MPPEEESSRAKWYWGLGFGIAALCLLVAICLVGGLLVFRGDGSGLASRFGFAPTETTVATTVARPTLQPTLAAGQPSPQPSTPGNSTPAPASTPSPRPLPKDAAPVQVLRIGIGGEPTKLDPSLASDVTEVMILYQIFEGLLRFDGDLKLQPAVAKEVPSFANGGISKDGLTYTLKLRREARWSDGKPITAKDFEYGLKRVLDPQLASPYASFYFVIKGAKEYATALGTWDEPKKVDPASLTRLRDAVAVKAVDAETFQITLAAPRASFAQLLALWPSFPLREDVIARTGWNWVEPRTFVGNGPFRMAAWQHGTKITLEPNTNYWGAVPLLQTVELLMKDVSDEYQAYLNNEVDIARLTGANVAEALSVKTQNEQSRHLPELSSAIILLNNWEPPFNQVKVRQAFSLAIDREKMVNTLTKGMDAAGYSWVPPGMPGHDAEMGKQWKFDPAQAKKMLADAGYSGGQGLPPLYLTHTPYQVATAEFIRDQIKANLGLDVELEEVAFEDFYQYLQDGSYMMAYYSFQADYPDPDNWLPETFGSNGTLNDAHYSNPQFDEAVKNAMAEMDDNKRLALWAEAQRMVVADAASVFLSHGRKFVLIKPQIKGLRPTALDSLVGDRYWPDVYLAKP